MAVSISVIIPLFNKERYIAETIQSVLSQSFQNWEMLIIDNLSTDKSFSIAQQFEDQRIKFLQCHQQGPGATRNLGIKNATGEWIQFLDGDDLLEPNHLRDQLAVTQRQTNADIIVSCWQEFTDANPEQKVIRRPYGWNTKKTSQFLKDSSIAYTPWAPHAALVKRSILQGSYLWPEELDQFLAEDTAFWFRLINHFCVVYSNRSGALYRASTPGCRTSLDIHKWFEGNHEAITNNLNYLTSNSLSVSARQIEYLIKFYMGIYLEAKHRQNYLIQDRCKREVDFWISSCFDIAPYPKISMILIKLVGLDFYVNLVKLRLKLTF